MLKQRGSTLIEILLVVAAVGFLILLIANIPNSINLVTYSGNQSLAREIASKTIEDVRATPYTSLGNGESSINDSRLAKLPDGSGLKELSDCDPLICTNSESTKKLKVTIQWREGDKDKNLVLETFVSDGGLK